jgi:diadenosine tetraphosphate (Ap4A) HIT family hydrolase
MPQKFSLHERLEADSVALADWPLCRLLLARESRWPWLILVPMRAGLREIVDLEPQDRARLIEEIADGQRLLTALYRPDKLNLGAIGNLVSQLHIHLVARFVGDPAWPKPIWGQFDPAPLAEAALAARLAEIRAALAAGRHRG